MQNAAITVSIPGDSLCPCSSNKSFKECCQSKNHVYESLIIDETGAAIIYDQTEIISSVKSLNSFIQERISNSSTRLTIPEALRKLKRLYAKFGEALKPMTNCVSCKSGCSHCCSLLILTSQLEVELINEYINTHFSEQAKLSFKEKIAKHKELLQSIVTMNNGSFAKESLQAYLALNVPCSFLDDSNRCSIYEVRPFICRKYLVFNSPDLCKNLLSKTNQYYSGYHSTVKDTIIKLNQLTYASNYKYKHLLSWFVE